MIAFNGNAGNPMVFKQLEAAKGLVERLCINCALVEEVPANGRTKSTLAAIAPEIDDVPKGLGKVRCTKTLVLLRKPRCTSETCRKRNCMGEGAPSGKVEIGTTALLPLLFRLQWREIRCAFHACQARLNEADKRNDNTGKEHVPTAIPVDYAGPRIKVPVSCSNQSMNMFMMKVKSPSVRI